MGTGMKKRRLTPQFAPMAGCGLEVGWAWLPEANGTYNLLLSDMALIDSHGYASIVGRIKDMIIRGGENISPREIEEVIHQHKSVIDVAVVGVPSHDLGEEVCAWVKLRAGETVSEFEIQEHCSALLSKQKVPRYVLFREDFPITANGKHQKNAMRTMSVHAIGLD
eukprot:GHVN01032605.1.p1 GENE.GHVN01032605.1~~GHVN01032605.1.p1  ORF type:complete len:166 (-),score=22.09 GHVN01032605.1:430-927(-)